MLRATISSFTGVNRFLSNFWPSEVTLDGASYPTVEHAYQAAKTLDHRKRLLVLDMPTPAMARRAGRRLVMRRDWDTVKIPTMFGLLQQKFAPETPLAAALDATGTALLEEGNTWGDRFWGTCNGLGCNTLGAMLMHIRSVNREDDFDALLQKSKF